MAAAHPCNFRADQVPIENSRVLELGAVPSCSQEGFLLAPGRRTTSARAVMGLKVRLRIQQYACCVLRLQAKMPFNRS